MLGTVRRVVAGAILTLLGFWLLYSGNHGPDAGRQAVVVVLAAAWGACGVALFADWSRARLVGLAASLLGLALGLVLAIQGIDGPDILLDLLFSPADTGRWYVVMPTGWMLAILSGIAVALLALPFRRSSGPR